MRRFCSVLLGRYPSTIAELGDAEDLSDRRGLCLPIRELVRVPVDEEGREIEAYPA